MAMNLQISVNVITTTGYNSDGDDTAVVNEVLPSPEEVRNLYVKIQDLEEKLEEERSRADDKDEQYESMVTSLKSSLAEKEDTIIQLKKSVTQIKQELKTSSDTITALNTSNSNLTSSVDKHSELKTKII